MNDILMESRSKDQLINKAGKGRYCQESAVSNLIRYIARENGTPKEDLVCCGAFGAVDFTDIEYTIKQFQCVQATYKRKADITRYIDHEIYSFSAEEENGIEKHDISLELLARKMANEFYNDGFQVYYGVHRKGHLHIHFAVNTVNYRTGKKRHENMMETRKNGQKFRNIVDEEIRYYEKGV